MFPLPSVKEAELVAKVGTGVLNGIQRANQPPPLPEMREALLELHAILREWCSAAGETNRHAQDLARFRRDPSSGPNPANVSGRRRGNGSNNGGGYIEDVEKDSKVILDGRVSVPQRVSGSARRRAARRGLRTIMGVYCPALLDQFEEASAARSEWVRTYRKNFDQWFDESHTDAEVSELLDGMEATINALVETTEQLRAFIATNYPLPGTNS